MCFMKNRKSTSEEKLTRTNPKVLDDEKRSKTDTLHLQEESLAGLPLVLKSNLSLKAKKK